MIPHSPDRRTWAPSRARDEAPEKGVTASARSTFTLTALTWLLAALLFTPAAWAQTVEGLDPHVSAAPGVGPGQLLLTWGARPDASGFTLRRRAGPGLPWVEVAQLPGNATDWVDEDAPWGATVEYHVMKESASGPTGNAYLLAGADVPFEDDRGAVALVVDDGTAEALAEKVARLEDDLRGDGFGVTQITVRTDDSPPDVKGQIAGAQAHWGGRLRAVLLLGAVPRPFSGLLSPDGHPDHEGAWPADGYYGEFSQWTDMLNLGGVGAFANGSGDGKFDHSVWPGKVEVSVGRVDAEGLPAFSQGPHGLLSRWLDRNHAYRHGAERFAPRAYVRDSFGYFGGEAFSRIAWRDSAAVLGVAPGTEGGFFDVLEDPAGYALAFGCGGGSPTSASGVAHTSDFASRAPRAAFLGLFGSYFGDWAYENNLLRAALLSEGSVMATAWFARPYLHLHPLGALRSFGDAFLASANNSGADYDTGFGARGVHQALLGDPTLRLFVLRPPSGLALEVVEDAVHLSWTAPSDEEVDGYHVYRRWHLEPEERLTLQPTAASSFVDPDGAPGETYDYRVVAVKKVTTGSGTFIQHSQGLRAQGGRPAGAVADGGVEGPGDPADAGVRPDGGAEEDAPLEGCGCAASSAPVLVVPLVLLWPLVLRRRVVVE